MLRESPIRPWIDDNGCLLKSLWSSLVSRALDIVSRFPGINGDIAVESLRLVAPSFGQEVLQLLCSSDVLYFKYHPRPKEAFNNGIFWLREDEDVRVEKIEQPSMPFLMGSPAEYYFFVHPLKSLHALNVLPPYTNIIIQSSM